MVAEVERWTGGWEFGVKVGTTGMGVEERIVESRVVFGDRETMEPVRLITVGLVCSRHPARRLNHRVHGQT